LDRLVKCLERDSLSETTPLAIRVGRHQDQKQVTIHLARACTGDGARSLICDIGEYLVTPQLEPRNVVIESACDKP
jgi:hypothetical protein